MGAKLIITIEMNIRRMVRLLGHVAFGKSYWPDSFSGVTPKGRIENHPRVLTTAQKPKYRRTE